MGKNNTKDESARLSSTTLLAPLKRTMSSPAPLGPSTSNDEELDNTNNNNNNNLVPSDLRHGPSVPSVPPVPSYEVVPVDSNISERIFDEERELEDFLEEENEELRLAE